jgi:hypothetical protein
MAKRSAARPSPMLFVDVSRRRHAQLFLPKMLKERSKQPLIDGSDLEKAQIVLKQWADLAEAGHLGQKETALDAEFLEKIFGDALGYKSIAESPEEYHREKQFTVAGAGTADGALGKFASGKTVPPTAIIELKDADTDLDHDKPSGRTAVEQLSQYMRELPDTPWGILSNYVTIRLYHRDLPSRAYEEFTIKDFRDPERVRQFFYIFQRYGLLGNKYQAPRALELLTGTQVRQREVGDELYKLYSEQRTDLIEHLISQHRKSQEQAIHIAQRIIDRIIFVAFCKDRGLLPKDLIASAYTEVGRFPSVMNPRWLSFKTVFGFIDRGNDAHEIPQYNGNLFKPDPEVDNLELDDKWTHFFKSIGDYDFKDEVNVEVLGHLFERSVTELEKLRVVGLFGKQEDSAAAMMPKSAERKRFGIYYTPPEFTKLIVDQTLGKLIEQRVDPVEDFDAKIAALRSLKVCDPACGSGAFLIAAYDRMEDAYEDVARLMRIQANRDNNLPLSVRAEKLVQNYPDFILSNNLYGVDVSAESVEITQLALWIRSARRGRTLADLSNNILNGNSLVRDPSVHPKAFVWRQKFSEVFERQSRGFDAVIGNPPWERMKLQEREFFSLGAPEIASTANASDREKLVTLIEKARPDLWDRYKRAQSIAEKALAYVRTQAAEFPLTGKGDVNTYMLFAELARQIVSPSGRAGLLLPSGIATDHTTKEFFGDLVESKTLVAIYDFVNRLGLFPDVESRLKFCVLLMAGNELRNDKLDFVFWAERIEDLDEKNRHVKLTASDLKLMNPNTHTCPIFRNNRDAELTRKIYRNVPVLIDKTRRTDGNSWNIELKTMFHQTNDSKHFKLGKELKAEGFELIRNCWVKRKKEFLPLFEAKMTRDYDHRASKVVMSSGNWYMNYSAESASLVEHQNPEFLPMGRWWVDEAEILARAPNSMKTAAISFHDIARANDTRTMVACMLPFAGVANTLPLIIKGDAITWRRFSCLLGCLNSLVFDFVARQKTGGAHLNFFIVEQIPTLPPDRYDEKCTWSKRTSLESWISERVLKLTCTSEDMVPLAEATGFDEKIHKWNEAERAKLRAELDAAFFLLYGIERDDIDYILTTFQGIRDEDEAHGGEGPTRKAIFDALEVLTTG